MSNKEVSLDAEGFATETGEIRVYNYSGSNGEYIGSSLEPIMVGFGIPAHSTTVKPPATESGKVAAWDEKSKLWNVVDDHRGEVVYSTSDGSEIRISEIGPYPESTTRLKPVTEYDEWNGSAWVTNEDSQHQAEVKAADAEKVQRVAQANATTQAWQVQLMLGIITDADKAALTTWMKYVQAVQAVDTSKAPNINWPAKPE